MKLTGNNQLTTSYFWWPC